jgi:hypothetical protein
MARHAYAIAVVHFASRTRMTDRRADAVAVAHFALRTRLRNATAVAIDLVTRTRRWHADAIAVALLALWARLLTSAIAVALLVGTRRHAAAITVDFVARTRWNTTSVAVAYFALRARLLTSAIAVTLLVRTWRHAATIAIDLVTRASAIAMPVALEPRWTADRYTTVIHEYFADAANDRRPTALASDIDQAERATRINAISIPPQCSRRTDRRNETAALETEHSRRAIRPVAARRRRRWRRAATHIADRDRTRMTA